MKKFFTNYFTRFNLVMIIVMVVAGALAFFVTTHNQSWYKEPIAKIETVTNGKSVRQKDNFDNVDHLTNQKLTATILNGKHRGQTIHLSNQFSDSRGMDQSYRTGDQIFVSNIHQEKHHWSAAIQGNKRDTVIVMLAWLAICLLLLIMRKKGSIAILSVLLNAVIFVFAIKIDLNQNGNHIMWIFGTLSFVFALLTLLLVLGPTKQMLATLIATVMGTGISMLISLLVFSWTHERGMYYESMQYVTQIARPLFLAETLLGSLGAVMDESTDIVATLFELKQLNPEIGVMQLFLSGRRVGQSIMGPLVNVLFMIFMADTFTSSLLYIKNGNSWGYTFAMNMSMGTVQSLISGIGIVLAIPVASAFAGLLLGKRVKA